MKLEDGIVVVEDWTSLQKAGMNVKVDDIVQVRLILIGCQIVFRHQNLNLTCVSDAAEAVQCR